MYPPPVSFLSPASVLFSQTEPKDGTNSSTSAPATRSYDLPSQLNDKRIVLFFKGLVAWAICMIMGYAFDQTSLPAAATSSEANSSVAFAVMMHCTGFSVFLLYFTGQIRWLVLNAVVGLSLIWVLNMSGMDNKWLVFSTHSVGYVVLAAVIVVMILVFGGVVLVWTHLLDFLKCLLLRYPEVQDELAQKKLLEQVQGRGPTCGVGGAVSLL